MIEKQVMINMEVGQVIRTLECYFDSIKNIVNVNDSLVNIDFYELARHSPDIAEYVLDNPHETQTLFDCALKDYYDDNDRKTPQITMINLPKDQDRVINRLRMKDLRTLITLQGVIVSRTKVFPRIRKVEFECPSCGNKINIVQKDSKYRQPRKCGCGRKGLFRELSKEFEDCVRLNIEELPERLKGSESPNQVTVVLKNKLCLDDYNMGLGGRVELTGYLEEEITYVRNAKSTICDFSFNAMSFKAMDTVDFNTDLSTPEKDLFDMIKKHKNPALLMARWIFKGIYGYRKAKECLIYQQFSGRRYAGYRDFIHILLYGMPGTAKTDLALRVAKINPICKVATGTDITKVGFTAGVVKDELTKKWTFQAGLLPRCNGGLAVIDELEKAPEDTIKGLHTPMENGFLAVNKSGCSAKVFTECSILSTSNPKVSAKGSKVSLEHLELPPAIVDRFDLIFTFNDNPDTKKDEMIAENILDRAVLDGNSNTFTQDVNTFEANSNTFHIVTLKKYIYLSKKVSPILSIRVKKIVVQWYSKIREIATTIGYEGKKPTPRLVESILRLARAIARSKMKYTVTQKELALAIKYFDFVYETDGLDIAKVISID